MSHRPFEGKQLPLLFRSADGGKPGPQWSRLDDYDASRRASIARFVSSTLDVDVRLVVHDNRRTMISSRYRGSLLELRLHHMFLDADGRVLRALCRYVDRQCPTASRLLGQYIEANGDRIRQEGPRQRPLSPVGKHHDLSAIMVALNDRWFEGLAEVRVTWGRHTPKKGARRRPRRSTIRLGTYSGEEALIRIHPVLDQAWVPPFFVRYVVFHEMLHHMVPPVVKNGRTVFHTPEFRALEQAYPDYDRAVAWEKKNIDRLMAQRRRL